MTGIWGRIVAHFFESASFFVSHRVSKDRITEDRLLGKFSIGSPGMEMCWDGVRPDSTEEFDNDLGHRRTERDRTSTPAQARRIGGVAGKETSVCRIDS